MSSFITSIGNTFKKHLAFFFVALLTALFTYPYHQGISPFDPGNYANCAVQLLAGHWYYNDFYCNRIFSYLPVALAIKLFGFHGYYLTLVTGCELVLLLAILYALLQRYNKYIALITCALVGFSPLMLQLAGTLYGDIMAALTSNLCILWIWYYRFKQPQSKGILAGVALAVMWYVALLTKEYALFFLVPVFIFFVIDKRAKRFNGFWNTAIISGVLLGLLFLSAYYFETGDFFHRLKLLENGPNMSLESYAASDPLVILARLTVLPVRFLIDNYSYFIIFVFTMVQLVNKTENSSERFFRIYLLSLLALWWMGTQSFKSWTPILLIDRLWAPLIVPMAINAAHVLYHMIKGTTARYATVRTKVFLALTTIFVFAARYINEENLIGRQTEFGGDFLFLRLGPVLFILLTIYYRGAMAEFVNHVARLAVKHYVLLLIVLIPLLYHFRTLMIKNPKDNTFLAEKQLIDFVKESEPEAAIITEKSVFYNQGIYYDFAPEVKNRLHFMDWSTIDTACFKELAAVQPLYLLVTYDRIGWYLKGQNNTLYPTPNEMVPGFVLNPDMHWKLVKSNSRITLYQYDL